MKPHLCWAEACDVTVDGNKLFCTRHWPMIPEPLKHLIINNYNPQGTWPQQPSDFRDAVTVAIASLKIQEGIPV